MSLKKDSLISLVPVWLILPLLFSFVSLFLFAVFFFLIKLANDFLFF